MSSRWDAVIIGSGISSLTCAALLARKGRSVCVLEQYGKPGGYMHCFSRFGVRFDTGAHYLGSVEPGQPFHALLSYLGAYDERLFVPLDPDGFDVFHFPELEVSIPKGYERLIDRLSGIFPRESAGIRGFLEQVREVPRNFPTYEFGDEVDVGALVKDMETSLQDVIRRHTSDPALQSVLSAYCVLHGVKAGEVSFGLHAVMMDSLIRGAYGLAKGGDALASALVQSIRRQGGEVRVRRRVTRIENTGRMAGAVITADGERIEADWIISGADPKLTFGLLGDPAVLSPAFRKRLGDMKMSGGIFGVYAACSGASGISPRQNHFFFDTAQDPDAMFLDGSPSTAPSAVFLSPVDRTAAGIGAAGGAVGVNLHATGPMEWFEPWRETRFGKRSPEYAELKDRYARQVIAGVERYRPGFGDSVTDYVTSSPVTNMHFNGATDGAAYGIHHSIQNTGARALGPRTHVANLLLTGQSCLFPGLLGAAISGVRTAGHIVGIKPMLKELREMRAER